MFQRFHGVQRSLSLSLCREDRNRTKKRYIIITVVTGDVTDDWQNFIRVPEVALCVTDTSQLLHVFSSLKKKYPEARLGRTSQ